MYATREEADGYLLSFGEIHAWHASALAAGRCFRSSSGAYNGYTASGHDGRTETLVYAPVRRR